MRLSFWFVSMTGLSVHTCFVLRVFTAFAPLQEEQPSDGRKVAFSNAVQCQEHPREDFSEEEEFFEDDFDTGAHSCVGSETPLMIEGGLRFVYSCACGSKMPAPLFAHLRLALRPLPSTFANGWPVGWGGEVLSGADEGLITVQSPAESNPCHPALVPWMSCFKPNPPP